jgi:hypothetical protein
MHQNAAKMNFCATKVPRESGSGGGMRPQDFRSLWTAFGRIPPAIRSWSFLVAPDQHLKHHKKAKLREAMGMGLTPQLF